MKDAMENPHAAALEAENNKARERLARVRDAKAGSWDAVVQSSRLIAECKDAKLRAEACEKVCELVLELAAMIGKVE